MGQNKSKTTFPLSDQPTPSSASPQPQEFGDDSKATAFCLTNVQFDTSKRILFVGASGHGKSTLVNLLYHGRSEAACMLQPAATGLLQDGKTQLFTTFFSQHQDSSSGTKILTDSVGITERLLTQCDEENRPLLTLLVEATQTCWEGFNAITLVIDAQKQAQARDTISLLQLLLGDKWSTNVIVVFTFCDNYSSMTKEKWIRQSKEKVRYSPKIASVVEALADIDATRFVFMDNNPLDTHWRILDVLEQRQASLNKLQSAIRSCRGVVQREEGLKDWLNQLGDLSRGAKKESLMEWLTKLVPLSCSSVKVHWTDLLRDGIVQQMQGRASHMWIHNYGKCPWCNTYIKALDARNVARAPCGDIFHDRCLARLLQSEVRCPNGHLLLRPNSKKRQASFMDCSDDSFRAKKRRIAVDDRLLNSEVNGRLAALQLSAHDMNIPLCGLIMSCNAHPFTSKWLNRVIDVESKGWGLFNHPAYCARGTYKLIFKAIHMGEPVALTLFNPKFHNPPSLFNDYVYKNGYCCELEHLRALKHKNIVALKGTVSETNHLILVTEWCNGGSLLHMLESQRQYLHTSQCISLMKDIAAGLSFMHSKNIMHRDLTPKNVLVHQHNEAQWTAKICDFGSAQYVRHWETSTPDQCTPDYVAPENRGDEAQDYTYSSDVFSCALVFFWILEQKDFVCSCNRRGLTLDFDLESCRCPFKAGVVDDQRPRFKRQRPVTPITQLQTLIRCMWHPKPEQRPSMTEVLNTLEEISSAAAPQTNKRNSSNKKTSMPTHLLLGEEDSTGPA